MCGIIGIVGNQEVGSRLIDCLEKLEYRGYDSGGIAVVHDGTLERLRAVGKLDQLEAKFLARPLHGTTGIGHMRWATHGKPTEENAHPHLSKTVAVAHNGIIENHVELRKFLQKEGYSFESETDTEVIAHLIDFYHQQDLPPQEAVAKALKKLKGSYALALIFKGYDDLLIAARQGGSPLVIGYGEGEMYLGSDALALVPLTQKVTYLEDGDWALLSPTSITLLNQEGESIERPIQESHISKEDVTKGDHEHFMLKEMYEQPDVLETIFQTYLKDGDVDFPSLAWEATDRLTIAACGTAYYAGLIAKHWFEKFARLPVEIDVASEFRYRTPPLPSRGISLVISQSGETIDTLAALDYMKSQGQTIVSIVNVPESSIARKADVLLHTLAGPEIGVASTKSFTAQLAVLALLALEAGYARGVLSLEEKKQKYLELVRLPDLLRDVLEQDVQVRTLASSLIKAKDVLFLGRGINYPLALEGALKLKEISYIHAEAYPAGEMKHGPIALLDDTVPVVVVAPFDELFEKTASNIQEVIARDAPVIVLTDEEGAAELSSVATFILPESSAVTAPFLYTIPLQFLAYYTALLRGNNVDQPRNLAKAVTVE